MHAHNHTCTNARAYTRSLDDTKEVYRSTVLPKTLTPEWTSFALDNEVMRSSRVVVKVFDKDRLTRDDFIGETARFTPTLFEVCDEMNLRPPVPPSPYPRACGCEFAQVFACVHTCICCASASGRSSGMLQVGWRDPCGRLAVRGVAIAVSNVALAVTGVAWRV
jgi:hypothetical protein